MTDNFQRGLQALSSRGLNLVAVLPVDRLIRRVPQLTAELPPGYETLVLIGAGGKAFWQYLGTQHTLSLHPVDDCSRAAARRAATIWRLPNWRLLYPAVSPTIPLQHLGAEAGWHHDSPLGLGVHANYGPWFAYRAVLITDAFLPATKISHSRAPCSRCSTKPCLAACPAHALNAQSPPDLEACHDFRLAPGSTCAANCLARLACPVGKTHRYEPEQIAYHYRDSLRTLRGDTAPSCDAH